jgi:hypothetical protein
MKKIRTINEAQYANMFLNEERHYPKFLDNIKSKVFNFVFDEITNCIKTRKHTFQTVMKIDCEFCDEIMFNIVLHEGLDAEDRRQYKAYYINNYCQLYNGKIYKPQITIDIPINNKWTNYFMVDYSIAHELTHLYDDWIRMKEGKESISVNYRNAENTNSVNYLLSSDGELYKGIGVIAYLSLKVERKAFLSQTVQELKGLGCNQFNYKEKLKETTLYNNLTKGIHMFHNGLQKTNSDVLYALNAELMSTYPKSNIPKCDIKTFNYDDYVKKLTEWVNNVYHQTMKRYGSVVSYYVDELEEEWNKHTSMFII